MCLRPSVPTLSTPDGGLAVFVQDISKTKHAMEKLPSCLLYIILKALLNKTTLSFISSLQFCMVNNNINFGLWKHHQI
jgi:hypothetical protein